MAIGNYNFSQQGSAYLDEYDELGYNPRGTMNPDELLDYEEVPQQRQQQEPSIPHLLQAQNQLLREQTEIRRQEAQAQLEAMNQMASRFQSPPPVQQQAPVAQQDPDVEDVSSFSNFWDKAKQNAPQARASQAQLETPPDPRTFVKGVVQELGAEAARAQREEVKLAEQFAKDMPDIASNYSREVYYDWEQLKVDMPGATPAQRYARLKEDSRVRYGGRGQSQHRIPPNGQHQQDSRQDPNDPFVDDGLSPAARMRRKNLETAKYVKHLRTKRNAITSTVQ